MCGWLFALIKLDKNLNHCHRIKRHIFSEKSQMVLEAGTILCLVSLI